MTEYEVSATITVDIDSDAIPLFGELTGMEVAALRFLPDIIDIFNDRALAINVTKPLFGDVNGSITTEVIVGGRPPRNKGRLVAQVNPKGVELVTREKYEHVEVVGQNSKVAKSVEAVLRGDMTWEELLASPERPWSPRDHLRFQCWQRAAIFAQNCEDWERAARWAEFDQAMKCFEDAWGVTVLGGRDA